MEVKFFGSECSECSDSSGESDKTKIPQELAFLRVFAERTRFELVVGLLLRQFSKLVVSATHPPLQWFCADCSSFADTKVMLFFEFTNTIRKYFCKFVIINNKQDR